MIRVAIFADIHGKFLLPFKMVQYYQNCTGQKIDYILQCGDMGAFPDKARMDKATLRHAKADRDELGFMDDFVCAKPEIQAFLTALSVPMVCVRGNHEDHGFLDELEQVATARGEPYFAIDAYGWVKVCRTGVPFELIKDGERLSVLGVGRIGDSKGRTHEPFIQPYEYNKIKELYHARQEFDMLITHDKPSGSQRGYGSQEIAELLDKVVIYHHFYGHTGEPYHSQLLDNGITQSHKIKELEFNPKGRLEQGCMLILEKDKGNISISVVGLSLLYAFEKETWKKMN